jgi:transcriptional regulator with GAF, ATPase, and Fis domain
VRFEDAARRCIADALATSEGRIYGPNGAAAILGLKPTTLVSKMQRLQVSLKQPVESSRRRVPRTSKRARRKKRRS